jgi:hypothetical protein
MIGRTGFARLRAVRSACGARRSRGTFTVVMVLPFVLGFVAALLAWYGRPNAALTVGAATVAVQVWWLVYHATDKLSIAL